jgi:hypothetical protein
MPGRVMSPELAFKSNLKAAQRTGSQGRATITKGEAEKALTQLRSPHASPADQARIVREFLDSRDARALSTKAREVLVDFVNKATDIPTGDSLVEVKAAAREETHQAERNVKKAQERLEALLKTRSTAQVRSGLQEVTAWLDAARADILQARAQLKKIAAHPVAKAVTKDLTQAQKEIKKAATDVQALLGRARGGAVKKADLQKVREWLQGPLPELRQADDRLGAERHTRKFPSDNEDGGGGADGPGDVATAKYPSDAEDAGGGGEAGDAVTAKYPSDAEDGGGEPVEDGGGMMVTLKYPSDNEDGGVQPVDLGSDKDAGSAVQPARVEEIRKAFQRVNMAGTVHWNRTGVVESHLGVRFTRVELMRERRPNGHTYTAYIPTGALNPRVQAKDPNKVNEFYVERTGGGPTMSAGPLRLG